MPAERLFIYGTLLPGHAPPALAAVCGRLRWLGAATLAGRLYDLGSYPAAVVGAEGVIQGELVEVDDDTTWRALDRYEGCPREGKGDGLFRRVRATATLHEGRNDDCWVYVYERDLAHAPPIDGGCWRSYLSRRGVEKGGGKGGRRAFKSRD